MIQGLGIKYWQEGVNQIDKIELKVIEITKINKAWKGCNSNLFRKKSLLLSPLISNELDNDEIKTTEKISDKETNKI